MESAGLSGDLRLSPGDRPPTRAAFGGSVEPAGPSGDLRLSGDKPPTWLAWGGGVELAGPSGDLRLSGDRPPTWRFPLQAMGLCKVAQLVPSRLPHNFRWMWRANQIQQMARLRPGFAVSSLRCTGWPCRIRHPTCTRTALFLLHFLFHLPLSATSFGCLAAWLSC